MAMGKRKRHAKQTSMWVATQDLSRSAAHPFYTRLNQILDKHDFDGLRWKTGYAPSVSAAINSEVSALLDANSELLEAVRRAALLAERLAARASLTADEARDVRHGFRRYADGADRMDAIITLRQQKLRPM